MNTATGAPLAGQFLVSPNPANNLLNIELADDFDEKTSLFLLNTLGQTVLEGSFAAFEKQHTLHLDGLSKGVYCLEIHSTTRREVVRVVIK